MINRLGIDKVVILMVMCIAILFFLLSACSPFELVCLTGLCPEMKERAKQIPWEPPSLNHQSCPNISGKYKTGTYKSARDYDELMIQFPSLTDEFGFIHASLEVPKRVPQRFIPMPTEKNPRTGYWDESEFYTSAYVLIQQDEQNLVVSLIGGDEELYRRQTISLDSSMIGCANGDFITRTVSIAGGADGTSRGATATEKRFRKFDNGHLQVTTHRRYWSYDLALGVTGIPKERGGTLTFASIP